MRFRLPSSSRRRSPATFALLAFALLLAQTFAQAHVYSHLKSGTRTDFNTTAQQMCGECLASAPLLAAAGTPSLPAIAVVPPGLAPLQAHAATAVDLPRHYAFRSRAPPQLLG